MRISYLKSAVSAAAVAAVLAIAPLQLGSAVGYPQALAASHGGNGAHAGGNVGGGLAGSRAAAPHHSNAPWTR